MKKSKYVGVIYMLTCVKNEKKYVGQTINLKRRLAYHFNSASIRINNNPIYKHIFFFGKQSFKVSVLEEIADNELDRFKERMLASEKRHILQQDSIRNGYNLELGNEITDDMKQNLSKIAQERVMSKETRKKIGDSTRGENNHNYGKLMHPHAKEALLKANLGRKLSKETKKKMSEVRMGEKNYFYGKSHSKKTLLKMSQNRSGMLTGKDNPSARRVRNVDKDAVFDTMKEAGAFYGIKSFCNISSACAGRLKTVGGFRWEYI